MTGQDWSKSRVAARHMTDASMLVIKGPASTVLPQLDQAQQGAAIQSKGWHSTAIIGQILQQNDCSPSYLIHAQDFTIVLLTEMSFLSWKIISQNFILEKMNLPIIASQHIFYVY